MMRSPPMSAERPILALTIHQPWAWAIAHADKRIENRYWPPPRAVVGQRIAIHAGKQVNEDAILDMGFGLYGRTAMVVPDNHTLGAVVAVATIAAVVRDSPSLWFHGPFGWVLADVVALPEPVPCRGMQKLWALPPDVEARVLAQVEPAAPAGKGESDG